MRKTNDTRMTSLIDYTSVDYRGFVFVVHEEHGLLLLHCTRKLKKGPHWQVPGGHVDKEEFERAGKLALSETELTSESTSLTLHAHSSCKPE